MIATANDLREQLNIEPGFEADDFLERKIAAAESWIETYIGTSLAELDPLPASITEAVLQLAAHLYENREATLVGVSGSELPFGVVDLIRPHRVWEI